MASSPASVRRETGLIGADALVAKLRGLGAGVRTEMVEGLNEGADGIVANARSKVRVRTGKLKGSIHKETGKDELEVLVMAGGEATTKAIGSRAYDREVKIGSGDTAGRKKVKGGKRVTYDYALAEELGHKTPRGKHVPPHPFFYPAVREERPKIKRAVAKAVGAALDKAFRGPDSSDV